MKFVFVNGRVGIVVRYWEQRDQAIEGRRSGDQFFVYVFDRLVRPTLSREQIDGAANGRLSLDGLTRQLIRGWLSYRFVRLTPEVVRSGGSRVGSQ